MAKFSKQVQGANITLSLLRKLEATLREAKIPALREELISVEEQIRNDSEAAEETAMGGGEYTYQHGKHELETEIAEGGYVYFVHGRISQTDGTNYSWSNHDEALLEHITNIESAEIAIS